MKIALLSPTLRPQTYTKTHSRARRTADTGAKKKTKQNGRSEVITNNNTGHNDDNYKNHPRHDHDGTTGETNKQKSSTD